VEGQTRTVDLPASDDPATFGPQDVVICALKAQQAHASAGAFAPLLGPRTAVLTAMNGIPWWYFYKERGPLDGHHLESVDPGAALNLGFPAPNRAGLAPQQSPAR
jgi:2-dehydropantoate 2-reductase